MLCTHAAAGAETAAAVSSFCTVLHRREALHSAAGSSCDKAPREGAPAGAMKMSPCSTNSKNTRQCYRLAQIFRNLACARCQLKAQPGPVRCPLRRRSPLQKPNKYRSQQLSAIRHWEIQSPGSLPTSCVYVLPRLLQLTP